MKTTDHLPTFRKKKQRKRLLRGLLYFSPVLFLFLMITALYLDSYEKNLSEQKEQQSEGDPAQSETQLQLSSEKNQGVVIQAGQEDHKDQQENKDAQQEIKQENPWSVGDDQEDSQERAQALAADGIIAEPLPEQLEASKEKYAIFLIAENGYLTAYNGDRTQVMEYTQIPLSDFPPAQQDMLTRGIYMKTHADYYDFLETYSS